MELEESSTVLKVIVTPKAKQNKIATYQEGALKIHVTAPPEKGKANAAVVELLSKHLHIAKRRIILLRGETSRQKEFLLEGISSEELLELFREKG